MSATPKMTTCDDLREHNMLDGLDQTHILAAMRLVPGAASIGDETLLAMANAVLLDRRHQGYGDSWVGVVPDGANLATKWDR